jgi:hypothetical protein
MKDAEFRRRSKEKRSFHEDCGKYGSLVHCGDARDERTGISSHQGRGLSGYAT